MIAIFVKYVVHGEDTMACVSVSNDIAYKTKGTNDSFVLNESRRFEQVHWGLALLPNRETLGLEESLPFSGGQGPHSVVDDLSKCILNLLFGILAEIPRYKAHFVYPVPSTWLQ